MDTPNVQGPVTTGTNPSRLVALGALKKKSVRKAVKKFKK
jgi:hypothetical protein